MSIQTHSVYKGSKKEFSLERERDQKMIKRKKMRHTTENSWFFFQVHPNLSFEYTLDLPFYKNQAANPKHKLTYSHDSVSLTSGWWVEGATEEKDEGIRKRQKRSKKKATKNEQ